MTEFRLRAARPGSGHRTTLVNLRIPGVQGASAPVDIVVEDSTILAIRPTASLSPEGERIDVEGRFVLPGLVDHHVHFTQWAARSRRLDLSEAASAADAVALVRSRIERDGRTAALLVAAGFRDALWPDRPDLEAFDRASGERAVVAVSADLHCVWLNTAALSAFRQTSVDGTGLLREEEAFAVLRALDDASDEVVDEWARDAAQAAAGRGVTSIVDFEMAWNLDTWRRRSQNGNTLLRVAFGIYPQDLDRAVDERLATGQVVPHTHGLVSVGSLKVITDGSLGTRTAWCVDPYPDGAGEASRGAETVPLDELVALMDRARRAGLRSAVHAIGDRANQAALDAFELTGAVGTLEHAQLLRHDDVARIATLPVVASVQPEHANDDRDVAENVWPGRTDRAYPLRSILDAGGRLAFGSDAPVAPLDPWVAIEAAVFRARDGREPWHPEQRVTVAEAIAASTHNRATQPRAGEPADLVVIDRDPYGADADALRRMPVAATMLAGRLTYDGR